MKTTSVAVAVACLLSSTAAVPLAPESLVLRQAEIDLENTPTDSPADIELNSSSDSEPSSDLTADIAIGDDDSLLAATLIGDALSSDNLELGGEDPSLTGTLIGDALSSDNLELGGEDPSLTGILTGDALTFDNSEVDDDATLLVATLIGDALASGNSEANVDDTLLVAALIGDALSSGNLEGGDDSWLLRSLTDIDLGDADTIDTILGTRDLAMSEAVKKDIVSQIADQVLAVLGEGNAEKRIELQRALEALISNFRSGRQNTKRSEVAEDGTLVDGLRQDIQDVVAVDNKDTAPTDAQSVTRKKLLAALETPIEQLLRILGLVNGLPKPPQPQPQPQTATVPSIPNAVPASGNTQKPPVAANPVAGIASSATGISGDTIGGAGKQGGASGSSGAFDGFANPPGGFVVGSTPGGFIPGASSALSPPKTRFKRDEAYIAQEVAAEVNEDNVMVARQISQDDDDNIVDNIGDVIDDILGTGNTTTDSDDIVDDEDNNTTIDDVIQDILDNNGTLADGTDAPLDDEDGNAILDDVIDDILGNNSTITNGSEDIVDDDDEDDNTTTAGGDIDDILDNGNSQSNTPRPGIIIGPQLANVAKVLSKDLDEVRLTLEPMLIFIPGLGPAGEQLLAAIDNFRKAARDLARLRGST